MPLQARYNGTYVAVKQLKSSDQIALGDFRTEMSTLRRLHHPNAVQFLGACTRAQPYLIVTELMSCSLSTAFTLTFSLTLRRQVWANAFFLFTPVATLCSSPSWSACPDPHRTVHDRRVIGALPVRCGRQVEVALEFARAMAYMHSRSPALIHRDLKPANIMIGGSSFMLADTALLLNSSGIVKVADFGLSKSLPKRGKSSGQGSAGPAAGAAGVASVEGMPALNRDTYRLTGADPVPVASFWDGRSYTPASWGTPTSRLTGSRSSRAPCCRLSESNVCMLALWSAQLDLT